MLELCISLERLRSTVEIVFASREIPTREGKVTEIIRRLLNNRNISREIGMCCLFAVLDRWPIEGLQLHLRVLLRALRNRLLSAQQRGGMYPCRV